MSPSTGRAHRWRCTATTIVMPLALQGVAGIAATAAVAAAPANTVSADTSASEAGGQQQVQLEEIIVTATKRETSVREIPASVAVLGGDQLEQRAAQGLEEVTRLVPGVNMTTPGDGATRITIRGIAAEPNTNPTVGILFGNLSFSDAYVPRVTMDPYPFDLKTVEVLKGPQGTLFGAGALNGAIRYVPAGPDFGELQGKYFAEYNGLKEGGSGADYGAALNLPLDKNDTLALRIVGFQHTNPGWVDNTRTGQENVNKIEQSGTRAILGWRPTSQWDIALTYAWQQTDVRDLPVTDNLTGDLTVSNKPRNSPSYRAYDVASLSVRYDLDDFSVVSESGYIAKRAHDYVDSSSRLIPDGSIPILAQSDENHSDTWSQELRLVSHDSPESAWRWIGGLFASRQSMRLRIQAPLGDPTLPTALVGSILNAAGGLGNVWQALGEPNYLNLGTDATVKEYAAFGDVTRRLGAGLELSVGGRLYHTTSGGVADQSGLLLALSGMPAGHEIHAEVSQTGFSPKVSLLWHASDEVLAYTAASRGFRVGGVQPGFSTVPQIAPAPDTFKSDTIWNYEIGTRTQWLDNRLHADLTAFLEEWHNPQTLEFDPSGLTTHIDNVGGVETKGLEGALQTLLPIEGLSFTASAAYTEAKTTKPFAAANGEEIPTGSPWPLSPKWQTATTLAYQRSYRGWSFGGLATHSFIGRTLYGLAQPDQVFGYQQWDAQLNAGLTSSRWSPELAFIVNNLADKRGVSNAFSGATYHDVTYIQPRTFLVRLSGKF